MDVDEDDCVEMKVVRVGVYSEVHVLECSLFRFVCMFLDVQIKDW